jgi:hypothetical protein
MGNINTALNETNIQTSQISQSVQQCNQSAYSSLSDNQITIIDSTVGDISLTNSLQIGNIDCTLTSTVVNSATSAVANVTKNTNTQAFPFSFDVQANTAVNMNSVTSFQQALVDQSCNQSFSSSNGKNSFTIIDSVTGNIVIANQLSITSQSCNLAASTSQMAQNSTANDIENKNSTSCFGADCCILCVPLLLGLIALPILSKFARQMGQQQGGGGGDDEASALLANAQATSLLAGVVNPSSSPNLQPPPPPRSQSMNSPVQPSSLPQVAAVANRAGGSVGSSSKQNLATIASKRR